MGHRALVAYRRIDGTFTLRYAHWGTGLAGHITPATPLGGFADWPDPADVADHLDVERRGGYDPTLSTRVDPRPIAVEVTAGDILAAVDATVESLVVVSATFETTSYVVCSLDPDGNAAEKDLVLAHPDGDPVSLRSWFVESKSRLSAAVADGALTREAASATLRRALAARGTVYPTDDASFLRHR